jgi:hypothetical protein
VQQSEGFLLHYFMQGTAGQSKAKQSEVFLLLSVVQSYV